jgi:hypothetical protein
VVDAAERRHESRDRVAQTLVDVECIVLFHHLFGFSPASLSVSSPRGDDQAVDSQVFNLYALSRCKLQPRASFP